jgi:hypothetical protein
MRASIAVPFALAVLAGSASGFAQSPKDQFVTLQPAGHWLSSLFIGQPTLACGPRKRPDKWARRRLKGLASSGTRQPLPSRTEAARRSRSWAMIVLRSSRLRNAWNWRSMRSSSSSAQFSRLIS